MTTRTVRTSESRGEFGRWHPTGPRTAASTVNTSTTGCDATEYTAQSTLSSGQTEVQPDDSYYYSATSGTHVGCLRGPSGTDFGLYMQKWNGAAWVDVAIGGTAGADEDTSYYDYRYVVHAYSGSGTYTLGLSAP